MAETPYQGDMELIEGQLSFHPSSGETLRPPTHPIILYICTYMCDTKDYSPPSSGIGQATSPATVAEKHSSKTSSPSPKKNGSNADYHTHIDCYSHLRVMELSSFISRHHYTFPPILLDLNPFNFRY